VTGEERDRIINEAHATLDRLARIEQRTPQQMLEAEIDRGAHFSPAVRAQRRRAAEPDPEVIFTDPITTPPPAAAIEPPPVIAEDYISELIATVIADVTAEFDRKLDALKAEVRELRSIGVADFREQLNRTVGKCDELISRLEKREPMRGDVIDLPPLPRRDRTGMN
jgi:hypothetical protein